MWNDHSVEARGISALSEELTAKTAYQSFSFLSLTSCRTRDYRTGRLDKTARLRFQREARWVVVGKPVRLRVALLAEAVGQ